MPYLLYKQNIRIWLLAPNQHAFSSTNTQESQRFRARRKHQNQRWYPPQNTSKWFTIAYVLLYLLAIVVVRNHHERHRSPLLHDRNNSESHNLVSPLARRHSAEWFSTESISPLTVQLPITLASPRRIAHARSFMIIPSTTFPSPPRSV